MATIVKSKRDDPSSSMLEELLIALGIREAPRYGGPYGTPDNQRKPSMGNELGDMLGVGGYQPQRGAYGTPGDRDEKLKQLQQYLLQMSGKAAAEMPSDWVDVPAAETSLVPGMKNPPGSPAQMAQAPPMAPSHGSPLPGAGVASHKPAFNEGGLYAANPEKIRAEAPGIMAQHANSGNRPSDILARQMFEKDQQLKQALEMMASDNPAYRERGQRALEAYQTERALGREDKTWEREDAAQVPEDILQQLKIQAAQAGIQKTGAETEFLQKRAESELSNEPFKGIEDRVMALGMLATQIAGAMSGGDQKRAQALQQQIIISLLPKLFPELGSLGIDFAVEE